jgi:hypothetical protein
MKKDFFLPILILIYQIFPHPHCSEIKKHERKERTMKNFYTLEEQKWIYVRIKFTQM